MVILDVSEELRRRLVDAGVAPSRADEVLDGAPPGWWDASVDDLTSDAMLIAPGLKPGQVRVRIGSPEPDGDVWELSIVAPDRPGLLARTASVCAARGMSITSARVASWPGLALQRMHLRPDVIPSTGEPDWTPLGQDLRSALTGPGDSMADIALDGSAEFQVDEIEDLGDGTHRVTVSGVDGVGLLAAITRTLWAAGADIRTAELRDEHGLVRDTFVVAGIQPEWLQGPETPPA